MLGTAENVSLSSKQALMTNQIVEATATAIGLAARSIEVSNAEPDEATGEIGLPQDPDLSRQALFQDAIDRGGE